MILKKIIGILILILLLFGCTSVQDIEQDSEKEELKEDALELRETISEKNTEIINLKSELEVKGNRMNKLEEDNAIYSDNQIILKEQLEEKEEELIELFELSDDIFIEYYYCLLPITCIEDPDYDWCEDLTRKNIDDYYWMCYYAVNYPDYYDRFEEIRFTLNS